AAPVEVVAEARLIAAGRQAGPGRGAVRTGDVAVGAADAVFRDRIEVLRGDVTASLEADVGVAEVVGQEDHDVGPIGGPDASNEEQQARGGQSVRSHGVREGPFGEHRFDSNALSLSRQERQATIFRHAARTDSRYGCFCSYSFRRLRAGSPFPHPLGKPRARFWHSIAHSPARTPRLGVRGGQQLSAYWQLPATLGLPVTHRRKMLRCWVC